MDDDKDKDKRGVSFRLKLGLHGPDEPHTTIEISGLGCLVIVVAMITLVVLTLSFMR